MDSTSDITVHLPGEHFEALSKVILEGLRRAKIDAQIRKELLTWWEAESEFIRDDPAAPQE